MATRAIRIAATVWMIAGVLLLAAWQAGAQDELIILEHRQVFGKLQRPAVNFFHERHAAIYSDCTACHHRYEYQNGVKANVWTGEAQSCAECHKLEQTGKAPSLRDAFHENCTTCHRTLDRDGAGTGPSTCGECHIRPEKAAPPHKLLAGGPTQCGECHIQNKLN